MPLFMRQHYKLFEEKYGESPKYLPSSPSGYAPRTGAGPVLCFLQGIGEHAPMAPLKALTMHGPLLLGISHQATDRFIVVAPQQAKRGGEDGWNEHADEITEIVNEVQKDYNWDYRDQTYLTVFSFGGNDIFGIALAKMPEEKATFGLRFGQWTQRKHLIAIPTVGFGYLWVHAPNPPKGKLLNFISILGDQPAANYLNGNFLSIDRGKDHMGTARLVYQDDQVYNWLLVGWVTSDQDGTDYDCAGLFPLDKPCYISLDSHSQTRKAYFGHEFVKHIPRQSLTLWCKSQETFAPFQEHCTHFHMNNARPPLDRLGYLEESEDG
jgi:predicted peptidase